MYALYESLILKFKTKIFRILRFLTFFLENRNYFHFFLDLIDEESTSEICF